MISNDIKLDFSDVLIVPKNSDLNSRNEVNLVANFKLLHSGKHWSVIPIIVANMDTIASFKMADTMYKHNCVTALHKHFPLEDLLEFFDLNDSYKNNRENNVFYSIGISDTDLSKLKKFESKRPTPQNICIDVANGYMHSLTDFVKRFRDNRPNVNLMVGNVVTPERVRELLLAGADSIKVGIGSSGFCTTRLAAGVGYPQFSTVLECSEAASEANGILVSDGGCIFPGDFSKALGAGADMIMAGSYFSGFDESGGRLTKDDYGNILGVESYGMSSATAMNKYSNGVADYRTSEGRTVMVPYQGSVVNRIKELLGGIRSTCTYTNSKNIQDLNKNCKFIRVNNVVNNNFTGREIK